MHHQNLMNYWTTQKAAIMPSNFLKPMSLQLCIKGNMYAVNFQNVSGSENF